MRTVILAIVLVFAQVAWAADFSVTNTNDSGAGSLRQAILDANALGGGPHTINFTDPYPVFGAIILASNLPMVTADEVRFHGDPKFPVIDGGANHSILVSDIGVTMEIEDMNFQFGVRESGGCIATDHVAGSGSLRVRRSVFTGCVATGDALSGGGAIYWNQDSPALVTIEDSGFIGNTATTTDTVNEQPRGGAISISATLILLRTVFRDNSVQSAGNRGGFGGAVFLATPEGAFSEIDRCTFDSNSVDTAVTSLGQGGAVSAWHFSNALLQLENSFFVDNTARFGGAVFLQSTTGSMNAFVAADNNTFAQNDATVAGGALDVLDIDVSLRHTTMVFNDAPSGSHVRMNEVEVSPFVHNVLGDPGAGTACDLTDTTLPAGAIVAANLFEQACGVLSSAGGTISNNLEVLEIDTGPPIGVVRFLPGADPIDGGTTDGSNCLNTDARGNPRPVDGDGDGITACDVGAYEELEKAFFKDGYETATP